MKRRANDSEMYTEKIQDLKKQAIEASSEKIADVLLRKKQEIERRQSRFEAASNLEEPAAAAVAMDIPASAEIDSFLAEIAQIQLKLDSAPNNHRLIKEKQRIRTKIGQSISDARADLQDRLELLENDPFEVTK